MLTRVVWRYCALIAVIVAASGCSQLQQSAFYSMEAQLRANRPEDALNTLKRLGKAQRDRALYALNRGMILRYNGDYRASIETFEQAKRDIGELGAMSISESLAAYTLSAQMSSYQATVYEKLFLHLYQIMNYLALNEFDSARVEAMQIDIALARLSESGHHLAAASARYIAGLIFEALGEHDNALIAYRRALSNYDQGLYAPPRDLQKRLLNLSTQLGLRDEHKQWLDRFGVPDKLASKGKKGQVVILYSMDFAPMKSQRDANLIDPNSGQFYRVSLPHFERRDIGAPYFRAKLKRASFDSEEFADIESMAIDDLAREMPKLSMQALSRNITRRAAVKRADEESEVLGGLINIVGAMFEQADLRYWHTLPNRIHIGSQTLAPGKHTLQIDVMSENNALVDSSPTREIDIRANQLTFVSFHWLQSRN